MKGAHYADHYRTPNVLAVYEEAAKKGWVIPCICSENLTTTEAILSAASEFAMEKGYDRIPITLAITNQYDHRSQSVFYTHTRRWDVGLLLFRASIEILAEYFTNLDILIHLDHAQHDADEILLDSDLSMFSSVMYDASTLPMEENIRKTKAYVERKVNIWTALERDSSPALTEWMVKHAAKCGGAKLEQKLIDEGYLTESSKTGGKTDLQHFTTTARQEIVFEEMKKIVRGYLDLWYK